MDIRYKCSQSSQCAWVKVIGGRCSRNAGKAHVRLASREGSLDGTAVGLDVHFLSISKSNHLNPLTPSVVGGGGV